MFRTHYPKFQPYIKAGQEVPLHVFYINDRNMFQVPAYVERFKRSHLFSGNTMSDVTRKILDSLICLVYQDIYRAIETHGYDAKLFPDEEVKPLLELDAHEVFDRRKDEALPISTRKNFCLKMHLNHHDQDGEMMNPFSFECIDTTIPGARTAPAVSKSTSRDQKNSKPIFFGKQTFTIDILLQLYPYYVKMNYEPFLRKLTLWAPYLGFYRPSV